MLDSLCQAIESYWSKGVNTESKEYAIKWINLIVDNYKLYLQNNINALKNMLRASNYSGKAINISKTTAPHSMSYKITSLYNIAYGYAVALCLVPCWKLLLDKSKSDNELNGKLDSLSKILKQDDIVNSINYVNSLITELDLPKIKIKEEDFDVLVDSVNIEKMHNNPIILIEKKYIIYINQ